MLLERAKDNCDLIEFIHLDKPQFWMPEVTHVFHGRDIFAPVAAHLASGVSMNALGSPISDPIILDIPRSTPTSQGWLGQVMHIDHFGNIGTNLHDYQINQHKEVMIKIKGENITGLVSTFGERSPGSLVALMDSSGSLAICLVNGNAAGFLHASVGDKIEVCFSDNL